MERIETYTNYTGHIESRIGGRPENQDYYGYTNTAIGLLVVVCDGMGGGPSGRTASYLATNAIVEKMGAVVSGEDPETALKGAVTYANDVLRRTVEENPQMNGMGTTTVTALFQEDKAYIIHVGDSRFYQLRAGKIIFRTADHSMVGELVRKKKMTEEEARLSSNSNIITRALGIAEDVDPEIDCIAVKKNDRFLLCTDGIWGAMSEASLLHQLNDPADQRMVLKRLADQTDELGATGDGHYDNLTGAIIDYSTNVFSERSKGITKIIIGVAALSIAVAAASYFVLGNKTSTDEIEDIEESEVEIIDEQKDVKPVDAPTAEKEETRKQETQAIKEKKAEQPKKVEDNKPQPKVAKIKKLEQKQTVQKPETKKTAATASSVKEQETKKTAMATDVKKPVSTVGENLTDLRIMNMIQDHLTQMKNVKKPNWQQAKAELKQHQNAILGLLSQLKKNHLYDGTTVTDDIVSIEKEVRKEEFSNANNSGKASGGWLINKVSVKVRGLKKSL